MQLPAEIDPVAARVRAALRRGQQVAIPAPDSWDFDHIVVAILEAVSLDHPVVLERDRQSGKVVASWEE